MAENRELQLAWEFVEHTGRTLFLTGKAGTGKTTFLKRVVAESKKRLVVAAPTGVAAINAGGVTLHSLFQLPLQPYIPGVAIQQKFNFSKTKRRILASLDLLIIDEVSMVRSDLLDAADSVLRRYRSSTEPFGGVQLLLIGDLQQLTPVLTPDEERLLAPHYDTPYFFGSRALRQVDYVTIELQQVFRQQQGEFLDVLNHIREGRPTLDDLNVLNARCRPDFVPPQQEGYVRLSTHNRRVDNYNDAQLNRLPGRSTCFDAQVKGTFPENNYPTSPRLELKVGAQVMFVKNDPSYDHAYYNGRIGHVESIERVDDERIVGVRCPDNGELVMATPITWENTTYTINEQTQAIEPKVLGTFRQVPLRLAWAITIHKSQGLTFDKAVIEADAAFASGQVYVALSRLRTLQGLVLAEPLRMQNIFTDQRVTTYIAGQQAAAQRSIEALPAIVEQYHMEQLQDLFSFTALMKAERYLVRQLQEFFSQKNADLLRDHETALRGLQTGVQDVAAKWCSGIAAMTSEQLHDKQFLQRVERGCRYFHDQLTTLLAKPVSDAAHLNSANKLALRRYEGAWEDLCIAYLTKVHTLRLIGQTEFSVANYLDCKQRAVLLALDGKDEEDVTKEDERDKATRTAPNGSKEGRREKGRKAPERIPQQSEGRPEVDVSENTATHKSGKKRVDTKAVTLALYKAGVEVEQIAKERHLQVSTIMGHLTAYVGSGELPLSDFVSDEQQRMILSAASQPDAVRGPEGVLRIGPLMEACPGISYSQICMTLTANDLL